jgi:hypothetical protein
MLGTCSSLFCTCRGQIFSSRPCHLPTPIPGGKRGIPLPPPITRRSRVEGRAGPDSSQARREKLFNDHPVPLDLTLLVVKDTKVWLLAAPPGPRLRESRVGFRIPSLVLTSLVPIAVASSLAWLFFFFSFKLGLGAVNKKYSDK